MINVTEKARREILDSMEKAGLSDTGLRIAARTRADGSFEYLIGFDEVKPDDIVTEERGIRLMYSPDMDALLKGLTLEFDILEEGREPTFIFLNPNDPAYVPPEL